MATKIINTIVLPFTIKSRHIRCRYVPIFLAVVRYRFRVVTYTLHSPCLQLVLPLLLQLASKGQKELDFQGSRKFGKNAGSME